MKFLDSRRVTIVLIALIVVFSIHVLARVTENLRADLTADHLYSLSEGTELILDKMHQEGVKPIEIKLYFSETTGKSLPKFIKQFITYENYLRALLREYALASNGKIEFQAFDPVPDSDEEQDALDYGLDGKPINQHGDLFFFGLVFLTQTGSKDVIEFLWPNEQEMVEYEITKKLHSLIWPKRKRVGVLSSLTVLSDATNPYMAQLLAAQGKNPGESWISMKLLQETYEVNKIPTDVDRISPDDHDLVVVIHPKSLPAKTLWALDEWVVRGGNTMIFIDPFALDDSPPQNPQQPWAAAQYKPSSNLERLMERWGVRRPEDEIAADFSLAVRRQVSPRGPAERVLVDLSIDPETSEETLNPGHPVLQGLDNLRFFLAGGLTVDQPPQGLELTTLISTTPEGNTLTVLPGFPTGEGLVFTDMNTPEKLQDRFVPGTEPVVLAYALQGRFDPAFPEGGDFAASAPQPPPGWPPGVEPPLPEDAEMIHKDAVPDEEREDATVLVFADVDFISDNIAFQNSFFGTVAANDNHKVLLNAVDYLMGSSELMKVRSKKPVHRPFTLFDQIEEEAARETAEREKQLRGDIERFKQELTDKQGSSSSSSGNTALFQKQLQDDVDQINERIDEADSELRDIRKNRRAALEREEARVRFATLWTTPSLVLVLGLFLLLRRKQRGFIARRDAS